MDTNNDIDIVNKINIMDYNSILNEKFLAFYQPFHEKYTKLQKNIKFINRKVKTKHFKIDLPEWCVDQRNQMTGPADDADLIIKMLNSKAPGVMVDFEDSLANNWSNISKAHTNMFKLFKGSLDQNIKLDADPNTLLWVRPRGFKMLQVLKFPSSLQSVTTSAALFDTCMTAFNFDNTKLPCKNQPLLIYIPKTEHVEEAKWWSKLFKDIAIAKGWPEDYIKCMVLVESYTIPPHLPQLISILKNNIVGLNLGRWDYMASLIEHEMNLNYFTFPDRNAIPHNVNFFQKLRKYMVNVCHHYGILAIGGMTALFPNRKNKELNDKALSVLAIDKENEAALGMDGAWTGHPDQNQIAVSKFPYPNQLHIMHDNIDIENYNLTLTHDDIKSLESLPRTLDGIKQAIRTCIKYRNGVLNGKGAVLIDGYMEDLATDRIFRAILVQRYIRSCDIGEPLDLDKLFQDEVELLLKDDPTSKTLAMAAKLIIKYIRKQ